MCSNEVVTYYQGHSSSLHSYSQRACQTPVSWVKLLIPKKLGWSHTDDLWVKDTEAHQQCPEASNALMCASAALLAAKFVFWKDKCIKLSSDFSSTHIISAQTGIALHITLRLQIQAWICSALVLKQLLSTDQNINTVQMTLVLVCFALSQAFASQNHASFERP